MIGGAKRRHVRAVKKGGGFTSDDFKTEAQISANSKAVLEGIGYSRFHISHTSNKRRKTQSDKIKNGQLAKGGLKACVEAAAARRAAGTDTKQDRKSAEQPKRNRERPKCKSCKHRKPQASFVEPLSHPGRLFRLCRDCRARSRAYNASGRRELSK